MKVFKVVGPYQLEAASLDGWELVQTIASSRADKISLQTPIAVEGCNGNNGSYPTPGHVDTCYPREEVVQVHEPLFMVAKERDVITREEQLKVEKRELVEKMTALSLKSQNDDKDIEELKRQVKLLDINLKDKMERMALDTNKLRKLEGDLAKVRTAVGTKAYEEALK